MAKLDDVKFKEPDSRLNSLGTTFRPGQKRIALPTSKQMSSPITEEFTASQTAGNDPRLSANHTPTSTTQNLEIDDSEESPEELGTTRHTNPAQLDTPTQHNQAQTDADDNLHLRSSTDLDKTNLNTQLGTTRHNVNHYEDLDLKDSSYDNYVETKNPSINKQVLAEKNGSPISAQPGTLTRHNSTHTLNTTRHNSAHYKQSAENKNSQPNTTRHNSTHGTAQLSTRSRHNSALTPVPSDLDERVNNLSGASAAILSFLCKKCLENGTNKVTITYKMLSELTGVKFSTIPTTCKRLRNNGFFKLSGSLGGAQAVRHFDLSDQMLKLYANELLNTKPVNLAYLQLGTTRHMDSAQLDTRADTNAPSKLVSNINNNLLPRDPVSIESNQAVDCFDVAAVNIDALGKLNISRKQIQDIKNQKLNFTTSTLQDFVDRFAIYASDPKNIRNVNSLPAIFVKMAQLASKGEDPLIDIETETDRLIRERLERLKAKREERLKQQTELMELEFESWMEEIQPKGWNEIAPPTNLMKTGSLSQRMTLKSYFTENIWPIKATELGLL